MKSCRNKFNYLKKIYLKIRKGGNPDLMKFRYLKEYEEIFGKVFINPLPKGGSFQLPLMWPEDSPLNSDSDEEGAAAVALDELKNIEWTAVEEEKLIQYFEKFHTNIPAEKRNMVWRYISKWFTEDKLYVSPAECMRKWKELVLSFKRKAPSNGMTNKRFFSMNRAIAAYNATRETTEEPVLDVSQKKKKPASERQKKLNEMRKKFQLNQEKKEREIEQVLVGNNFSDPDSSFVDENEHSEIQSVAKRVKLEERSPSPQPPVKQPITTTAHNEDGDSVQLQILNFLREKEMARQQRHEEYMSIQRQKLKILEKLYQNKINGV